MQTQLADFVRDTPHGRDADAILRKCVHCGFCTATCPTYQLLGDELDGPRGRIYLIKQLLEGAAVTRTTQRHLDRCLTCLNCETTCPSGVRYGRLVDIGREITEQRVSRPLLQRGLRALLRGLVPHERRMAPLLRLGRLVRPLLPGPLREQVPPTRGGDSTWPAPAGESRRMIVLRGCVQPLLAPEINAATARVLQRVGVRVFEAGQAGCCGAVNHHLTAPQQALTQMRRNIDAWWPLLQQGAECIIVTASGCGAMIKQYGELLAHDAAYRDKAAQVAASARDLSEVLDRAALEALGQASGAPPVACHTPCTLQHALKLAGRVEQILPALGFELTPVAEAHLCCGSAGTYSILQKGLAEQLRDNKLHALRGGEPGCIATANIGCLHHLQSGTDMPVLHWVELVDRYCGARA